MLGGDKLEGVSRIEEGLVPARVGQLAPGRGAKDAVQSTELLAVCPGTPIPFLPIPPLRLALVLWRLLLS